MPVFVHKEIIPNSCSDIVCRVFHDCVKHVESVTFLTSSLLKNDFRISQRYCFKVRWTTLLKICGAFAQHVARQLLLKSVDVSQSYSKEWKGWRFLKHIVDSIRVDKTMRRQRFKTNNAYSQQTVDWNSVSICFVAQWSNCGECDVSSFLTARQHKQSTD